ncbi:DNA polymerase III subunit beta [Nitrogeniibacter aestuarii]|uniref:DNA polymerase III subunit beta n=1 Tax=Nitrogeniibacter aestuarii TaxID=2815343 RepID=UPI001D104407|nr:DNA polymerase III subunit beta [Nitrogeniibacter aestuarii]
MQLLTTTRDALLGPLQSVSGIVEKRHTLPILSNVLIEKRGSELTMLATDIEIQIRTTTEVAAGEDVSITVGARKLQDILRALPGDNEVALTLDDSRMTVKAGRSRFALQTLPAADYPRLSVEDGEGVRFTVQQGAFKKQLALVQYAMAQQDIRYYLNGLLTVIDGNVLRMVATDGHRLAYAESAVDGNHPRTDVILPRKTVLELARQLADSEEPLEVIIAGNQIVFRFGPIELISKLIDGKFPDYERVIPKNHPKELHLARQPLHAALTRVAILTNDKFRGVRVVLESGSLKIVSSNAEQEEAQEELEIDYQGEGLDIGFNVTYLLDVLNNVSVDEVVVRLNDGNSSALISLPGNDNFKYVVMPMRI